MKNLKQPQYDEANLINFRRKNVWMNQVKQSKSEHSNPPIVQVVFVVACILLVVAAVIAIGRVWG